MQMSDHELRLIAKEHGYRIEEHGGTYTLINIETGAVAYDFQNATPEQIVEFFEPPEPKPWQ